ncbi:hypothetical protein ASPCAL10500 [Aspergillus calidoustus]|uniref:BZIP domain-containing protein n=1 Tax=Aspergillus calidoustus TaxID=454130 RepID=A0A0U5G8X2_ASPCI|nr:hypothetical protein ASPCAL10500 [Aspergillus calidoustus]
MARSKRKTKEEDLARVRNNQRRSRERKKAHVAELEDKVQRLEAAVAVADASVATEAPSLEMENRFLKGLLESVGFERGVLEGYLQGLLRQYSPSRDSGGPAIYGTGYVDQVGGVATMEPDSSALNPELFGALDLDSTRTPQSVDLPLNMVHNQVIQPNTGLTMTEDLVGVISRLDGEIPDPNNSVNSETTLCSVAFHLIIQCNRTGKDVLQIETRLRTGYKMPTCPGEGCRVDNMILLGVLAELV